MRRLDLLGQTFGQWTVVAREEKRWNGSVAWRCRCTCGLERIVIGPRLKRGEVPRCCYCAETKLIGQTFGKLTVIAHDSIEVKPRSNAAAPNRTHMWRCRCECGQEHVVSGTHLLTRRTDSCGCSRRERISKKLFKHGLINTPTYRSWVSAKTRCHNPRNPQFPSYGGRGIFMHPEWRQSFPAFLAAVGARPSLKCSLDRIDNDRGYVPGNVRWATHSEQQRNKRSSNKLTAKLLAHQKKTTATLMLVGLMTAATRDYTVAP